MINVGSRVSPVHDLLAPKQVTHTRLPELDHATVKTGTTLLLAHSLTLSAAALPQLVSVD